MRVAVTQPMSVSLFAFLVSAASLSAACADPRADGQRLGEQHVALLRAEQLTFPRLTEEFEAGRAEHRSHQAKLDFTEGYASSITPVRAEIAALAGAHAARTSASALVQSLEGLGRDLGHAAGGLLAELKAASSSRAPELREVGRSLGQALRSVDEGAKSLLEGVDEGFRGARPSAPAR